MPCDSVVMRRTRLHQQDLSPCPNVAKRKAPDAFPNHPQELPTKFIKAETKSTTTHNHDRDSLLPEEPPNVERPPPITQTELGLGLPSAPVRLGDIQPGERSAELALKVKYESSVRRFAVPAAISLKELRLNLAKKMVEDKTISVEYKDEAGDRVLLSSEKDMVEFSRIFRSCGTDPVELRVNLWPR